MTRTTGRDETRDPEQSERIDTSDRQLKRGSIGVPGVVTMVIAGTAPLTAMASNFTLSFGFGNGAGTVGTLVLIALLLIVFSAGYLRMSRAVTNAAAYYAFIGFGLGRRAGSGAALVATIAYSLAGTAMIAATGYFTAIAMSRYAGVDQPWWLWAIGAWLINLVLGYVGLGFASRVTSVLCVLQFIILIALAVAIVIARPHGFSVEAAFSPASVFSGNVGMAILFALLSFAGYEASAAYGEEAKGDRRVVVRRATYCSLAALTIAYVVATWAMAAAESDIAGAAAADPGGLLFTIAERYLGGWIGGVLGFLIAASFLAAMVAFTNLATRYLFSLGRAGVLPRSLGRVNASRQVPLRALCVHGVVGALVLAPFALMGADPLAQLFPAVSGITSLSLVSLLVGVCLSVLVAHRQGRLPGGLWETRVAPAVSGVLLAGCGGLIVVNYAEITGSTSWAVNLAPGVLIVGIAYGWWRAGTIDSGALDQALAD